MLPEASLTVHSCLAGFTQFDPLNSLMGWALCPSFTGREAESHCNEETGLRSRSWQVVEQGHEPGLAGSLPPTPPQLPCVQICKHLTLLRSQDSTIWS